MSIFIALLSLADPMLMAEAKFSILTAPVLSGMLEYIALKMSKKNILTLPEDGKGGDL